MIQSGNTYAFNNAVATVVQFCETASGYVTWTENGKERHTPTWYFEKYAKLKSRK